MHLTVTEKKEPGEFCVSDVNKCLLLARAEVFTGNVTTPGNFLAWVEEKQTDFYIEITAATTEKKTEVKEGERGGSVLQVHQEFISHHRHYQDCQGH